MRHRPGTTQGNWPPQHIQIMHCVLNRSRTLLHRSIKPFKYVNIVVFCVPSFKSHPLFHMGHIMTFFSSSTSLFRVSMHYGVEIYDRKYSPQVTENQGNEGKFTTELIVNSFFITFVFSMNQVHIIVVFFMHTSGYVHYLVIWLNLTIQQVLN